MIELRHMDARHFVIIECRHLAKGHVTRNGFVDDIVDVSSSTMAFNVAKIVSSARIVTKSPTTSLRMAGP